MKNLVNAVSQVQEENNTMVTDAEQPSIVINQGEEKDFDQHPVFTEENFMTPAQSSTEKLEFIDPEAAHILSTSISKGDVNQTVKRIDNIVRTSYAIRGNVVTKITLNVFLESALVLGKKKGAKFINEVSDLLHNDEVEDDAWFKYLAEESANSRVFEGILKEFLEVEIEHEEGLKNYNNVKTVVDVLLPKFTKQIEELAKAFKDNDVEEYKRIMFLIEDLIAEDDEVNVLIECLKESEQEDVVVDTLVKGANEDTTTEEVKKEKVKAEVVEEPNYNEKIKDLFKEAATLQKETKEKKDEPKKSIQVIKSVGPLSAKKVKELHDKIQSIDIATTQVPTDEEAEMILNAFNSKPDENVSKFYGEDFYKVNETLYVNIEGRIIAPSEFRLYQQIAVVNLKELIA